MQDKYLALLFGLAVASSSFARGAESITTNIDDDGSLLILLIVVIAFYAFITSNFGMTLLLFGVVTASVIVPIVFAWYLFRDASPIEAIAYSSFLVSLYWGPLLATLLPDDGKYVKIKKFAHHAALLGLFSFIPASLVGGVLFLVFDSEQARAIGVLGTLCLFYYWSTRDGGSR